MHDDSRTARVSPLAAAVTTDEEIVNLMNHDRIRAALVIPRTESVRLEFAAPGTAQPGSC